MSGPARIDITVNTPDGVRPATCEDIAHLESTVEELDGAIGDLHALLERRGDAITELEGQVEHLEAELRRERSRTELLRLEIALRTSATRIRNTLG